MIGRKENNENYMEIKTKTRTVRDTRKKLNRKIFFEIHLIRVTMIINSSLKKIHDKQQEGKNQ